MFLLAVSTLMWCGVGDAVAGGLGLSREAGAWSVRVCISVEGDRRRKLAERTAGPPLVDSDNSWVTKA